MAIKTKAELKAFNDAKIYDNTLQLVQAGDINTLNNDEIDSLVGMTGDETIGGIKTFSLFPFSIAAAPYYDYQFANKKYVDDLVGDGFVPYTGATEDVDLGVHSLTTPEINLETSTINFNDTEGVIQFTTDISGVTNQVGLEDWTRVINNTGVEITNGKAVYISGIDGETSEISLATNADSSISNRTIGLVTSNILDGDVGFVTTRGFVRDMDTSSLTLFGPAYLDTNGDMTMTKPLYPNSQVIMGGVIKMSATHGIFQVGISRIPTSKLTTKAYNFTSQGVGAGTYYNAGFYEAPAAAAGLTDSLLNTSYGIATQAYAAHAFVVCGGAGTCNTGVVGLRCVGTTINDAGVLSPTSVNDIIINDITSVTTNEYYEARKFVGSVKFELFIVSGSPTTYSLDINYGYAKYEDFGNNNFTLAGIETVGIAGASDTNFELIYYHHSSSGWTYSLGAFEPGGTEIVSYNSLYGVFDSLTSGENFALKRVPLNLNIDGADGEGMVIKIVTGANNTIQSMDTHLGVIIN